MSENRVLIACWDCSKKYICRWLHEKRTECTDYNQQPKQPGPECPPDRHWYKMVPIEVGERVIDEREYWRSVIVGRVNEQQPIYAGELLDELVDLRESHQKLMAFTRNHLRRVHECLKERATLRKRVEALETENVKLLADAGDYSGQWDRVSKEDRSEEL